MLVQAGYSFLKDYCPRVLTLWDPWDHMIPTAFQEEIIENVLDKMLGLRTGNALTFLFFEIVRLYFQTLQAWS